MIGRLGLLGAFSVWAALVGGIVIAGGDATGVLLLDLVGAVLLAAGIVGFFGAGIKRSRQEGVGLASALAQSAKDALRLAWYVLKSG
jgi:hypothetical protein